MPIEIELTPDRARMAIAVYRDGSCVHRDKFDPMTARARKRVADEWGIDDALFFSWCEEARVRAGAVRHEVSPAPAPVPGSIVVRPLDKARTDGREYAPPPSRFVKEVLPRIPLDCVAEWESDDAFVCLDVDYHESTPPDREWLTTLVSTRLIPRPLAWHFSRGGGLHLFYVNAGAFTAAELAACAALRYRSIDSTAGVELKRVVRGPGDTPVEHYEHQDTASGAVAWLGSGEYDEAARDEWLDEHGMECGRRYEHTKCPIDPTDGAERDPVVVTEAGVFCHRCNGKGYTLGSRRAGFVPWNALLGAPSAGELGGLVRHLVHWGHARWVLTERYGLPEPFARLAYSAALKAYHEGKDTECIVPRVFDPVNDELHRVNDNWMTIEKAYEYSKDILAKLSRLPTALREEDGKVKADAAIVCELNQTKDMSHYGYRNIAVVHGYRLAHRFLPDPDQTTVAVLSPNLLRVVGSRRYPRYTIPSKRMSADDAWGAIEGVCPRVDRTYIRGMIASFGCAQETRTGLHPIIFASGVSAAGKTAMAHLAAGIIGARIGNETKFDADEPKFRAAIRQGAQEGPVVVINELFKDAGKGRWKMTSREALDFILTITPASVSHGLYKGPVKMGRLPSLVITETQCPDGLREETQLARRIRHHYVAGEKRDWKETIAKAGLSDLALIRSVSDHVARACDAIMSQVIDDCFSVPMTWDTIAESLGMKTIEDSTDFEDMTKFLRELFRLVCAAPELIGKESKLHAPGYKKIARADNTPGEEESDLASVYSLFATPGNWADGRKLHEKDWGRILGASESVRVDMKPDGPGTVFIRFCTGPVKKPTKVNSEILNPADWPKVMS